VSEDNNATLQLSGRLADRATTRTRRSNEVDRVAAISRIQLCSNGFNGADNSGSTPRRIGAARTQWKV
jgi:hypothetical protein